MITHAPEQYICPICVAIRGEENEQTLIRQSDIVFKDDLVTAFINSFFIKNNPGHVIVVPNEHVENIYALPDTLGAPIFTVSKRIAIAMKEAYRAEGITTIQNNEPAGDQHAYHYHLHIFPRYTDDQLHENMHKQSTTPEERKSYADKIKQFINRT